MLRCLCIVALCFTGCVTPPRFSGVEIGSDAVLITSVPPLLQSKRVSCGPTCLSAVAAYWEKDFAGFLTDGGELSVEMSASDLERSAQKLGLMAHAFRGNLQDVETHLRNGRPIIALIPAPPYVIEPEVTVNGIPLIATWRSLSRPRSHWVIVIGVAQRRVIFHDPAVGNVAVLRSTFESWWGKRSHTMILVTAR